MRISVTCVLVLLLMWFSNPAYARVLDFIIALVDNEVILNSDFQEYRAIIKYQAPADAKPVSDGEILEDMVLRTIQLSRARDSGIRISDNRLNQVLAEEARRNGRDPDSIIEDFKDFPGGLESYRRYLRDSVTIQELRSIAIRSIISITELDARHFLASELGRSNSKLVYDVAFLSMPTDKIKSDPQSGTIDEIIRFLREDSDFKQQLEELKEGYSWIDGKVLDPRFINDLPTIFSDIVPMMSVHEVSDPIYDGDTTYVLKVIDVRGAEPVYQNQVRARHILLKPSVIRNQEQTTLLLSRLRSQINDGDAFEHVAKTYSEDPGTKNSGGSFGWQPYSFFTPEFGNKLKALSLLEMSEPFRTPFGWHIAQVLEYKKEDISEKLEIEKIRNYLFQQKINDELPRWLNQLREASYVEIRDTAIY